MTDRIKKCVVTFDRPLRIEDAEEIMEAIGKFRYVETVKPGKVMTALDYIELEDGIARKRKKKLLEDDD